MIFSCYVLGCGDDSIVSANHKMFGRVSACAGHNPITHGYDRPLVAPVATISTKTAPKGGSGSKVLATRPGPSIPPNDGDALQVPTYVPPVARKMPVLRAVAPMKGGSDLF